MPYEGLLPLANDLAKSPMMDVYEHMINKINGANVEMDTKSASEISQCATICDLHAYLLMVVAAGVDRIEKLKSFFPAGLDGKSRSVVNLTSMGYPDGEDSAACFVPSQVDEFDQWMTQWSKYIGPGVVQFKFNPGPHTFMVERMPFDNENKLNSYRVFQAYEGTYRLADFLGLSTDAGDKAYFDAMSNYSENALQNWLAKLFQKFTTHEAGDHKEVLVPNSRFVRWKLTMSEENHGPMTASVYKQNAISKRLLSGKSEDTVRDERWKAQRSKVLKATETAVDMFNTLGHGSELNEANFRLKVIHPLKKLLGGQLEPTDLQQLTGVPVHTNDKFVDTDRLIVLACDRVNPQEFKANYDQIKNGGWTEKMTEYVVIHQSNEL